MAELAELLALTFTYFLVVALCLGRIERRRVARILTSPAKDMKTYQEGLQLRITLDDRLYTLRCRVGFPIISFSLSTELHGFGHLQLVTLSKTEMKPQKLGLCKGLVTGDWVFDRIVHLKSYLPDFAKAVFQNPAHREAALELSRLGYDRIDYDGRVLRATHRRLIPDRDLEANRIERAAAALDTLAQGILKTLEHSAPEEAGAWKVKRLLGRFMLVCPFILFPFVAILTFLNGLTFPLTHFQTLAWIAVPVGVFLTIPYGFAGIHFLRGEKLMPHTVTGLPAAFLLTLTLFLISGVLFMNGYRDPGPGSEHRVLVLEKTGSEEFPERVAVESWGHEGSLWLLEMQSDSEFEEIIPNETYVTVTTKPGRLGFEWIEKWTVEKREKHALSGEG